MCLETAQIYVDYNYLLETCFTNVQMIFSTVQGAEVLLVNDINQQLCVLIAHLYNDSSATQARIG